MSFYFQFHRLLCIVILFFSPVVFADQMPTNGSSVYERGSEENKDAFSAFKQSLTNRFQMKPQAQSLPSTKISASDCDIELVDVSQYGDRIHLIVKRGNEWPGYFNLYSGAPMTFSPNLNWFSASTYTETCEEQGCDGIWYEYQRLYVSATTLEITHVDAYQTGTHHFVCHLL